MAIRQRRINSIKKKMIWKEKQLEVRAKNIAEKHI
jgi:hypothetical protein